MRCNAASIPSNGSVKLTIGNGSILKTMPGPGAGTAAPPQQGLGGIFDKLFPQGQEGETMLDKMRDPLGKDKAEKERVRKEKINELYGGGKTAFKEVSALESIAQNAPEKLPFGTLLNNMRFNGISNKPFEMINQRMEDLKASCFSIAGAPFSGRSSYQDL